MVFYQYFTKNKERKRLKGFLLALSQPFVMFFSLKNDKTYFNSKIKKEKKGKLSVS